MQNYGAGGKEEKVERKEKQKKKNRVPVVSNRAEEFCPFLSPNYSPGPPTLLFGRLRYFEAIPD